MTRALAAGVLSALLVSIAPAAAAAEPVDLISLGGTAVVGVDVDPLCLNVVLDDCNVAVAHTVVTPVLAGAFRVRPDFSFEPMLVDRVDVQAQPFTLTYHIKRRAVWSDGTPITAADFVFTAETIRDPANHTLKAGYERITEAVALDAKTARFRFSAPNPDWKSLFPFVLPKHVLAGRDFDQVWRDEIANPVTHAPIASGPFLFTGRVRGQSLTLSRNPRWWGSFGPYLSSIVFRIVPTAAGQLAGIRDGSLDLVFPQPQTGLADLARVTAVAVEWAGGTGMEHLDFNVASTTMPLLRETWFRQAVAFALDRTAVAEAGYDTLVPGYPALQSLSFVPAQAEYEPVFARYAFDAARVATIMRAHGCALGPDAIWVCGGVRASVKFATTTGNSERAHAQQLLLARAKAAGIELIPDNAPGDVLFGTRLASGQYELIMFTWLRGAGLPPVRALYGCGGEQNFMGYCSSAVTDLALRAETELDPGARARLINDANRLLADDVPSLPLFQRLAFLVHRTTLLGPRLNPAGFGTWNAETWISLGWVSQP